MKACFVQHFAWHEDKVRIYIRWIGEGASLNYFAMRRVSLSTG